MKFENNTLRDVLIHLALIATTGLVITILFFYFYLPARTNHGETVTVPDLQGIHMDDINEFLTKRNLRFEVNDSAYVEDESPLTILQQYPKPGEKVKEGRKIFVSVNRINPPTVPVPELLERSLLNARAVLRSNELRLGKISYQASPFLNLVLEMKYDDESIEAGERIPKGSVIDLVIGDGYGAKYFPMPSLVGMELSIARFNILGSNLEIGLITVLDDTTGQKSIVIRHEPAAEEKISIGDPIDLWIAPETDSLKTALEDLLSENRENE